MYRNYGGGYRSNTYQSHGYHGYDSGGDDGSDGGDSYTQKAGDNGYTTDYAKSSQARCRGCQQKILRGELRIGANFEQLEYGYMMTSWHHFRCFKDRWLKYNPNVLKDLKSVKGVNGLLPTDVQRLRTLLPGNAAGNNADDDEGEASTPVDNGAPAAELLKTYKEKLEALSNTEIAELLEHNKQPHAGNTFGGRTAQVERLADAMVFGALPKCPSCAVGHLVVANGRFSCTGDVDAAAGCGYAAESAEATAFCLPEAFTKSNTFLRAEKFKVRGRAQAKKEAEKKDKKKKEAKKDASKDAKKKDAKKSKKETKKDAKKKTDKKQEAKKETKKDAKKSKSAKGKKAGKKGGK